jgi:hypothetical protein
MNPISFSILPRVPRSFRAALFAAAFCLLGCGKASPPSPQSATPRPVTTSAANSIHFTDVAAASGLHFQWPRLPRPTRNLESFGTGCSFLDYDNDGWQDILLVAKPHCILYHNMGNGQFEQVTEASGIAAIQGDWKGCAVGDYDGDGYLDIVLTGYRRLAVLHSEQGRRFTDVTKAAGLDPNNRNHWGSGAGFMDLRGNGLLDLVILNYVVFNDKEPQFCELRPGIKTGCPPSSYKPEFGELWQNLGGGKFKDATASSGMQDTNGKGLVVGFVDPDNTGRMDFYIGNDGTPAEFMHNAGGLRFRNIGVEAGVAYLETTHPLAAMTADWGDYDRDGRMDLIVTNFSDHPNAIFRNIGGGPFENVGDQTGITGPTTKPLGFGGKWLDFDNDGWLDMAIANGHVYDAVDKVHPGMTFRQPMMLFQNLFGNQFVDLVPTLGGDVAKPLLGRGLATGDFDNDGRVDILIVDYEGAPVLLHNESQTQNHWITLDLRGSGPNHFAYGAQVTARAGKEQWVGQVSPASSYLSSSDPRVHFGLGKTTKLDSITIRWPDGKKEELHNLPIDRIVTVSQGKGITPPASH